MACTDRVLNGDILLHESSKALFTKVSVPTLTPDYITSSLFLDLGINPTKLKGKYSMQDTASHSIESLSGSLLNEGKTKKIFSIPERPGMVKVFSKDDITAGDGKRHDVVPGKGAVSNKTTCGVFRFLRECGLSVAFQEQISDTEFVADHAKMIPIEVVWRRRAVGSELERLPFLPKLHVFPHSVVELHLKTSGKRWNDHELPADDPLMQVGGDGMVGLYHPHQPLHGAKPFMTIPLDNIVKGSFGLLIIDNLTMLARKAFLALERAYCLQGFELIDGKLEVGINHDGRLVIADVIDAESIRLMRDGKNFDKQLYRDEGLNPEVMERFAEVLKAVESFRIPRQRVIIWAGSVKDDIRSLVEAVDVLSNDTIKYIMHTRSIHKEAELGLLELRKLVQECPQTVIIADIGMSNGAGPTLSAHTGAPVITLPKNWKEFPEDVWSCLRTPSNVPVSTMLNPTNAVLQALQILALNNPQLYMVLQSELEKRMINTVQI